MINRLPQAFRAGYSMRAPAPRPTLAEVVEAEPQVGILLDQADSTERADFHDYEWFKRQLSRLVGWDAKNPSLATSDVYDVVIRALTDALKL